MGEEQSFGNREVWSPNFRDGSILVKVFIEEINHLNISRSTLYSVSSHTVMLHYFCFVPPTFTISVFFLHFLLSAPFIVWLAKKTGGGGWNSREE